MSQMSRSEKSTPPKTTQSEILACFYHLYILAQAAGVEEALCNAMINKLDPNRWVMDGMIHLRCYGGKSDVYCAEAVNEAKRALAAGLSAAPLTQLQEVSQGVDDFGLVTLTLCEEYESRYNRFVVLTKAGYGDEYGFDENQELSDFARAEKLLFAQRWCAESKAEAGDQEDKYYQEDDDYHPDGRYGVNTTGWCPYRGMIW